MTDPIEGLTRQIGELTVQANRETDRLTATLRHIDETREHLKAAGIVIDIDLGDIGNAAAAARRVTSGKTARPFQLPKAV